MAASNLHQLERDIKRNISRFLDRLEIFHASYSPYYGRAGMPDIVACYNGLFLGIEVKREKGVQTALQKNIQKEIEAAGGVYILARSIEDVRRALTPLQATRINQLKGAYHGTTEEER